MPITFPFFLFAKPMQSALRWIRIDLGPAQVDSIGADPSLAEAQRKIAQGLPPHLRRDVMRDE